MPSKTDNNKNESDTNTTAEKPVLNEREQKLFMIAMSQCLKGGAPIPEIDFAKFVQHGEFKTDKTAKNVWGVIKTKLHTAASANGKAMTDGEGAISNTTSEAPKKAATKKRPLDEGSNDNEGKDNSTPKKKKSPSKANSKKLVKANEDGASLAEDLVIKKDPYSEKLAQAEENIMKMEENSLIDSPIDQAVEEA